MIYDIDYNRLVIMLTPQKLRRGLLLNYLYVAVGMVRRLSEAFGTLRERTDYRMKHNGQVCYLEALLNDEFDATNRLIRVVDAPEMLATIIYKRSAGEHPWILRRRSTSQYKKIVERAYTGDETAKFQVVLRPAMYGMIDEQRLSALVGMYKLASMRYKIVYRYILFN